MKEKINMYYARCCCNCEHCGSETLYYPGYGRDGYLKCNIQDSVCTESYYVCDKFEYSKKIKEIGGN